MEAMFPDMRIKICARINMASKGQKLTIKRQQESRDFNDMSEIIAYVGAMRWRVISDEAHPAYHTSRHFE